MKIVIISDIHDNLVNLEKCFNWCQEEKIGKIICCGDVTNSETLKFLAENFSGEIFLVYGNQELFDKSEVKKYKNIIFGGRTAIFEIAGYKVGLCHEPFLIEAIFSKGQPDIIFYGHTHKPWIEERAGIKVVNPGTLGGVFTKATFAVWDTENSALELKVLEQIK